MQDVTNHGAVKKAAYASLTAEGMKKKADYDLLRSGLSPDGIPHAAFINGHNGMYAYGPEHMISPDYAWDGKPVNPASERYSPRPAAKAPAKPAQFSMGGSPTTSMSIGNAAKGLTFSGPDGMNFMSSPVNPTRNFSNGGTFTVGNAPAGMTVSTPKPGTASISPSGAAAKAPVKPTPPSRANLDAANARLEQARANNAAAQQRLAQTQAPARPAAPAAKPAARPAVAPRPKPMARPRVLRGKAGLIGGLLTAAGLGAGAYAMSKIPAGSAGQPSGGTVTPNGPAPEPQQKDLDLTSANAYNKALNEGRKSDAHMIQRMNTPQQKDLTGIDALRAAGAMPDQVRGPQNSGNPFTGESGLTPGLGSGVTTQVPTPGYADQIAQLGGTLGANPAAATADLRNRQQPVVGEAEMNWQDSTPQYDPSQITSTIMRQYRRYTGARNMNSDMDRWKTWQAMQGNRNASNADYYAAMGRR